MKADREKNYLAMIEGSVGANMFRRLYVVDEQGAVQDVANDGEYSCAIFVSSVLTLHGMIDQPHATVTKTTSKMQEHGWSETQQPAPGDVVEWGKSADGHEHIGFVVGEGECVSNSQITGNPQRHMFTMQDGREPIRFWRYAHGTEGV